MSADRVLPFVRALPLTLAVCASFGGCSPSEVVVHAKVDPAQENLMRIGAAYQRYNTEFAKPPTSADQIKRFLKEFGNPDEMLRSPRDGQPYVICWGTDLAVPPKWAKSTPVLAYEKQGAQGKRYVMTTLRSVTLMTDKEFQQASFPPGHAAPK